MPDFRGGGKGGPRFNPDDEAGVLVLLFRHDRALGGRLVEVTVETIPSGGERPEVERDLGIAGHDFLDPERIAFELFGGRIEVADDQRDRRVSVRRAGTDGP